ncbi:hypothetical protein H112_08776 [Trichophyton rubrum D6]|uniref:Uncharacterized protein n=2 Tax=Trichophyton TaxID=5550 RepID=A0A022VNI4_TRIRU|nr:hypothetical protein H100_08797 [Trichophyton rubrum MR850]EZF36757.1 hypothetical protein H102_08757 [Trichophyton rubrum CBS 100081]EZF47504.1 hypothetical protein H103_08779 [Trichophyton rubrum CBS 288.86]EZF62472.1 hypothetical protein H104_04836 [Trichophyton rubrum CBS 289.86]EZF68768.1 hypothetical protein H105_08782 [Trichophyton soudanense CBS 452.61]EZF79327.1 hypothetical protein H110_08781 [Trichophyton rubrum MR1448]EZF90220.1 hypothetical protein H113_08849 [Trichophyton rub
MQPTNRHRDGLYPGVPKDRFSRGFLTVASQHRELALERLLDDKMNVGPPTATMMAAIISQNYLFSLVLNFTPGHSWQCLCFL